MKQPMISIVMPVYNSSQYIKESINSVLKQSYKNLEFIIIDD
ncbi:MAG: glycosyltransferase, partial [Parabacteroides sp.]|nr:glycosyltransferase [Parabacteroides sp.]